MSNVLVIGEIDGTDIKNISQQVAAVASGMGEVTGLVIGSGISEAGMKLAAGKITVYGVYLKKRKPLITGIRKYLVTVKN